MKIQSLTGTIGYTGLVREKGEGGSSWEESTGEKNQQQSSHPEYSDSNFQEEEPTSEKINQALESFKLDSQTLSNGLSAAIVGNGPGLRVVLKDGGGSVLKQLTGGEFVRLRRASSKDLPSCGKILDRKL